MENKISLKKFTDTKVVPPVRKLQSNKTIEQSLEARKNPEEKPLILPKINTNFNTNNKNITNMPKTKKMLTPIGSTKNDINNNTINQNNLNETNTTSN